MLLALLLPYHHTVMINMYSALSSWYLLTLAPNLEPKKMNGRGSASIHEWTEQRKDAGVRVDMLLCGGCRIGVVYQNDI